jgi:hypothetical protein
VPIQLLFRATLFSLLLAAGALLSSWQAAFASGSQRPIAAYSFDAGEGEVAEDLAGEHDGALESTEWVKGKYGSAIYLDGHGDYVEIADSPELQLTEEFTIEAWVRPDGAGAESVVVSKEASSFYSYQLFAGGEEAGVPEGFLAYAPFEWEDVEAEDPLTPKTWNHLALTYDGAAMRLYVNGELADTDETAPPAQASVGPLLLGGNDDEEFFKGRLDEVRIYERALEAGEVGADRGAPIETPQAGPIAAYSFDAGEGEVAEDLAGEHDGALEGAEWTNGRYGGALYFDNEESCASVPSSPELELTEEFTIETWVKPEGSGVNEPLISKETEGYFSYSLYLGLQASGKIEGLLGNEEEEIGPDVESDAGLPIHIWSHVALTYDGATMRLYVNGELQDSAAAGEGALSSGGPLNFGCSEAFEDDFKGRLDEVRIYERALEAGEAADITPPTFNGRFFAVPIAEGGATTVFFPEAFDAASPFGKAPYYTYRYAINEGSYTAWQTTTNSYFTVSTPEEDETISLQVYANDAAGNRSATEAASVSALPEKEATEYDEDQLKEIEEAELADSNPAESESLLLSEGGALLRGPVPPNKCTTGAAEPHISTHAKQKGFIRINSIGFIVCGLPGVTGWLTSELRRVGPYGTYTVSSSGRVPIKSPVPQQKVQAIIDPYKCVPGTYFTVATSWIIAPPPSKFSNPKTVIASNPRTIKQCK